MDFFGDISTNEEISNLKSPHPAKGCFHSSPGVPPDGHEEHDVNHDEHYRIDGAIGRVFVGHASFDHERQEIGEKDDQASLHNSRFAEHCEAVKAKTLEA